MQKAPELLPGLFVVKGVIEKGRENSALFIPNLTINLTYLCYGKTKLLGLREITKKNLHFLQGYRNTKGGIEILSLGEFPDPLGVRK